MRAGLWVDMYLFEYMQVCVSPFSFHLFVFRIHQKMFLPLMLPDAARFFFFRSPWRACVLVGRGKKKKKKKKHALLHAMLRRFRFRLHVLCRCVCFLFLFVCFESFDLRKEKNAPVSFQRKKQVPSSSTRKKKKGKKHESEDRGCSGVSCAPVCRRVVTVTKAQENFLYNLASYSEHNVHMYIVFLFFFYIFISPLYTIRTFHVLFCVDFSPPFLFLFSRM